MPPEAFNPSASDQDTSLSPTTGAMSRPSSDPVPSWAHAPLPDPPHEFRLRLASSPSRRDPYTSTHFSTADEIDRALERYGHRIWGFVIYRTTYTSNEAWARCISKIQVSLSDFLSVGNGSDLLAADKHPLTVFDDVSLFDRASTSTIRGHFLDWTRTAPSIEQHSNATAGDIRGPSPRYAFCLAIDEDAMRSILDDEEEISTRSTGYVALIQDSWRAETDQELVAAAEEGNVQVADLLKYESLEGCRQWDVGWMRVCYMDLIAYYCDFDGRLQNWWSKAHRRPPEMARN